jgi:multicomponent Na+:H+ antiporter subunit D
MPITMAAFVVGGLSLIGVPGTVGFVSKWYLVTGALDRGWTWVAVMILLSSLLAVVYVWKIIEIAYFGESPDDDARDPGLGMLLPTLVLIGGTIVFGLQTELTAGVAKAAAVQLLGGGIP